MKKYYFSLFFVLCLVLLGGCNPQQANQQQQNHNIAEMSIQTAVLSQEERRLLSLLGSSDYIFDYHVDKDLQSASVFCYQLDENSQWQPVSGGGKYNVNSANGRLALQFKNLADNLQVRFQSPEGAVTGSGKNVPQQTTLPEDMTLENIAATQQNIVYNQEIPLIIQCQMPKKEYTAFKITDFSNPEQFTQQGIHTVYALTIRFSRNQLGDNLLNDEDTAEPGQQKETETTPEKVE